jgi:ankyrin repeat protein
MTLSDKKKTHARSLQALGLTGPNADVNAADRHGNTPLMKAAAKGNIFVVKRLLAQGADIHAQSRWSGSALEEACDRGHAGIARLLLTRGAAANPKNTNGHTPLMAAAEWGHVRVMELLIKKGANVNAMDDWGRTALNTAAIDHWHTIPLLLQHGAEVHAGNDSAIRIALRLRNKPAADLLQADAHE